MARLIVVAIALCLATAVFAPPALADTCYETAQVNIDCSAKSPGAPQQGQPTGATNQWNDLRQRLYQSLHADEIARNSRIQEIKDLADAAIRDYRNGDLQSASSFYGAAVSAAGDDPDIAARLQRYVEAGTGVPLNSWYGQATTNSAAAPAAVAVPAAAEQPADPPAPPAFLGIENDPEYKKLLEDPRSQQVQEVMKSLSPECQQIFGSFLQAAENHNSDAASAAYGQLRDRCDAQIHHVAEEAGASLPERVLNDRMMGLARRAMGNDPNAVVAGIGGRAGEAGGGGDGYDAAEVMNFGLALLGILGNASALSVRPVSIPSSMPRMAAPTLRAPTPPPPMYRPPPPTSNSTITGLGN